MSKDSNDISEPIGIGLRLMIMTSRLNQSTSLGSLQAEYRHTWHQFTQEVENLQSALTRVPLDEHAITQARARVDLATGAYRAARNALACALLAESGEELSPLNCSQVAA